MYRIQLLDYGRFVAALSVIAFHYFFGGILGGKITTIEYIPSIVGVVKYGYLGVVFFFMISGYVIFFSAKNRTPSEFAVSRSIRLYPAFWAAVLLTSVFSAFLGGDKMQVELSQILFNLTLLAPYFNVKPVDGVYWTLLYEIQFYALVLLLLLFGLQNKLEKIFIIWPFLMVLALLFKQEHWVYLGGYYSYFSAGILFAIVKNKKTIVVYTSLIISLILCIMFSVGKVPELMNVRGVYYSSYLIGLIVCVFFSFFFVANSKMGSNLNLYGSKLLGALTYPIYLIHAHIGYMLISQFSPKVSKMIIYPVTITIVLLFAYFIHKIIEAKFSELWKNIFSKIIGAPINYLMTKVIKISFANS